MAIRRAFFPQRAGLRSREVLQPVGGFGRRSASPRSRRDKRRRRSAGRSPRNSWVPNVFGSMTPPQFGFSVAGQLVARADAVTPVILVREAATRPTDVAEP